MRWLKALLPFVAGLALCPSALCGEGREWVDSSDHKKELPEWVTAAGATREKDGKLLFRTQQSINGAPAPEQCYELCKADVGELVARRINTDAGSGPNQHAKSIAERYGEKSSSVSADDLRGKLADLQVEESYFVRYKTGEAESMECYVLHAIKKSAYDRLKADSLYKFAPVDEHVKDVITGNDKVELFPATNNAKPKK